MKYVKKDHVVRQIKSVSTSFCILFKSQFTFLSVNTFFHALTFQDQHHELQYFHDKKIENINIAKIAWLMEKICRKQTAFYIWGEKTVLISKPKKPLQGFTILFE